MLTRNKARVKGVAAVLGDPALVLHVIQHLVPRDAVALLCTSKAVSQALKRQLGPPSTGLSAVLAAVCCPRIVVVASGAKKLVEIALKQDGQAYDAQRGVTRVGKVGGVPGHRQAHPSDPGPPDWLTGIAVHPDTGDLYVCDYGPSAVVRYDTNTLSRQEKFPLANPVTTPEGITYAAGAWHIACIESTSVISFHSNGTFKRSTTLPNGLVPWGMTAWEPERFPVSCFAGTTNTNTSWPPLPAAGSAAGSSSSSSSAGSNRDSSSTRIDGNCAALFVAVDVPYHTVYYTIPPEKATGGVLYVELPEGATPDSPAQVLMYSKAPMKRPSGLTFDHAGHLWVTSAQQQLLRLAGPLHKEPGALLQTLNLPDLLPGPSNSFYPFDVKAIIKHGSALAAAGAAAAESRTGLVRGSNAVTGTEGCSTQLVVTLHRGPRQPGAVAVLALTSTKAAGRDADPALVAAARIAAEGCEELSVRLAGLIQGSPALKEPNMIAVLS